MQKDECREKFDLLFVKLDRIDVALRGNGVPGVLMRLDRLERPERAAVPTKNEVRLVQGRVSVPALLLLSQRHWPLRHPPGRTENQRPQTAYSLSAPSAGSWRSCFIRQPFRTAMALSLPLDAPDRQTQRRCGRFRAADSHPPLPRRWVVERTFAWLGRSACRQAGTAA